MILILKPENNANKVAYEQSSERRSGVERRQAELKMVMDSRHQVHESETDKSSEENIFFGDFG